MVDFAGMKTERQRVRTEGHGDRGAFFFLAQGRVEFLTEQAAVSKSEADFDTILQSMRGEIGTPDGS